MSPVLPPSMAWRIWQLSAAPASRRFDRALTRPEETRALQLRRILAHAAGSRFAETYRLHPGLTAAEYAARVPVMDAAALSAWTAPLLAGAQQVSFGPSAERLIPTSGSTGPVKLVPMGAASRREYALGVNLWVSDLLRAAPSLRRGRAYIATSPALDSPLPDAEIPVGYAEDEAYLGWLERRVMGGLLAVPTSVARLRGGVWRQTVREALLSARDLTLLSLWHPSYLEALFAKEELAELPFRWPQLRMISCWADGGCQAGAARLQALFPQAALHAKGLWLTEGVVTLPWRGMHPLALLNGYHEFEEVSGEAVPLAGLRKGAEYRILLSNHAGLYRYRLGDVVEMTGHLGATPCFRWVGRADAVSDLCGEKLSEAQVARALIRAGIADEAWLQADAEARPPAYRLITRELSPDLQALEAALCENPHYRWARELGQLGPLQVAVPGDEARSAAHPHRKSSRLGAAGVHLPVNQ